MAISPAKSLPMQAFMLYMSGGGVQIFSMGIVFMLLSSPFKNVASINTGAYRNLCAGRRVVHQSFRTPILSIRPLCTRVIITEVPVHSPAAEDCVLGVQPPHPRARAMEMSVDGSFADRNWRLASL